MNETDIGETAAKSMTHFAYALLLGCNSDSTCWEEAERHVHLLYYR